MFYCMDEVDNAYVRALFPTYLLEQPIGNELWRIYYKNRKLFRKLKSKGEALPTLKETRLRPLRSELSYETRKEIWEKLMTLGVLGTIPYDAVSDEYLVQVYQYFYPEVDGDPQFGARHASGTDEMQVDSDINDLTKPVVPIPPQSRSLGNDNEDDDDDDDDDNIEDEDDGEGAEERDDDEDDDDDDDVDDDDNRDDDDADVDDVADDTAGEEHQAGALDDDPSENLDTGNPENQVDVPSNNAADPTDPVTSAVSPTEYNSLDSKATSLPTEPSNQVNFKKNTISQDIYRHLGYPLPHAWEPQSNNSILLSSDGCTQLKPNPEYQALSTHDRRSSSVVRPGFSENLSNYNTRQEYVTTIANNTLLSKNLAIFYYEIRVLSTLSFSAPPSSRIKVGFRDLAKLQVSSASSSRTDLQGTDANSINRQSASIMRATLDSTSSGSSSARGDASSKGCFVYGGQDGNITDGVLSKTYSNSFGQKDVIGCGINYVDGTIFFTKNGVHLGVAFTDIHDIDVVPYISLTAGTVIRTNFGLHEEFLYDILGYQRMLKAKAYRHIYKSIDGHDGRNDFGNDFYEDAKDDIDIEVDFRPGADDEVPQHKDGFLLQNDDRISGDQMYRPEVEKLNNLNTDDDSIPCTMNAMINDFLIHEGLIDVAKGFLVDLRKDSIPDNDEERAKMVIRHNERQIIKEETNLKVRQDIRRLISEGSITESIAFIQTNYPGLLQDNIDVLFELKVAAYLLTFVNFKKHTIDEILHKGQELTAEFVYNSNVPVEYKEGFQNHLNDISSLLAYDNPLEECNEDLAVFLTPAYLQNRLFQLINSRILMFLKKKSESSLENMLSYTRAMINALMEYGEGSSLVRNDSELRVHKLVNVDEDLLN
ncbi:LANO_0D01244g1_1 [Lachancea nothofagi CBS 11611]|uniref:LANO_0D01244g1_1 n=1 Tax=Lachancea nothofagi CBS 11611 TaxID=1266666 RepID=A0A1G4JDB2_9SACH|nr:LANO_0D01244g1_1 [Lachancea nothofagi CBS 11611]